MPAPEPVPGSLKDGAPGGTTAGQPSAAISKLHFGGPLGALVLTVALPILVYYLWICVHYHAGELVVPRSLQDLRRLVGQVPPMTPRAVVIFFGWLALQAALQVLAPGRWVQGLPLDDGVRLRYRMNGWAALWITLALLGGLCAAGVLPATALYEEAGALLTTAVLFSYLFCVFLYFYGLASKRPERRTGHPVYDFFMGTSLNPRVGDFDIKLFLEARVSLIGWLLLDLSLAAAQLERHGTISTPMVLVCALQLLYVADHFYFEDAMLSTLDIRYENFGFMLCFGVVVWVPFVFSLQAYYLLSHPHELPLWASLAILAFGLLGFYIFRSANLQKHRFREDPTRPIWGRPPEVIKTRRGTSLLVSGWWGIARKANYLGDLMIGLAFSLPCGFANLLPYFYTIYFAPLLINRERRDDEICRAKYGADWDEYGRRVRFRIIPGIY